MRALVGLGVTALVVAAGCSVLFDGSDLDGRADGSAGVGDMSGGGGGGSGGADMAHFACTALAQPPKLVGKMHTVGGNTPNRLGAGDMDGDGHADIVSANRESNDVSVMLGDGAGNFMLSGSKTFASGCPAQTKPYWLALGDFNGDRRPDLAITCYDFDTYTANGAVVILNTTSAPGAATFAAPQSVNAQNIEQDYIEVATGDFTGDHKDDLAISHYGLNSKPGSVVILVSNGDGTFSHDAVRQRFVAPSGAADIGVGDLNHDGLADLVVGSDEYWLLELTSVAAAPGTFNQGKIGFDATAMKGTIAFPNLPVIADMNGDGRNDVIFAEAYSSPAGYAALFLQDENGAFPVQPKEYPASKCPIQHAVADFNCDGKLDVIVGSAGCNDDATVPRELAMLLQGINTTFPTQDPKLTLTNIAPYGIAVADFNEDGLPDIVVGSGYNEFGVNVLTTTRQ
jgi:hypothetical protein